MDPLAHVALNQAIQPHVQRATEAINAVHRRPVNLRKVGVTSSEAVLRGARVNADLESEHISEEESFSAYSLLAPDLIDTTARTMSRSPLQLLAKIDVACGGPGRPVDNAEQLQLLARIISASLQPGATSSASVISAIVHGDILTHSYFGQRSATVARVAMRAAAVAGGFDPRGLCVPETYLRRHKSDYQQAASYFAKAHGVIDFVVLHLDAFCAGAAEAESIAEAAR